MLWGLAAGLASVGTDYETAPWPYPAIEAAHPVTPEVGRAEIQQRVNKGPLALGCPRPCIGDGQVLCVLF